MNKVFFALALLVSLLISNISFALSEESRSSQNDDGTPRFADPDEQKPAFLTSPAASSSNPSSYAQRNSVTPPNVGDQTYGAQAFDRAFAHQQSKE